MNLTYYPLFSKPVYKVFLLTVMQSLSTMYLHFNFKIINFNVST